MREEVDDLIKIPNITVSRWRGIEVEDYPRRQGWVIASDIRITDG